MSIKGTVSRDFQRIYYFSVQNKILNSWFFHGQTYHQPNTHFLKLSSFHTPFHFYFMFRTYWYTLNIFTRYIIITHWTLLQVHPTFPLSHWTYSQVYTTFPFFHWTFLQIRPNLSILSLNLPSSTSQPFHLLIELSSKHMPTIPFIHWTFLQVHPNLSRPQPLHLLTFPYFSIYLSPDFHLPLLQSKQHPHSVHIHHFHLEQSQHLTTYSIFPLGTYQHFHLVHTQQSTFNPLFLNFPQVHPNLSIFTHWTFPQVHFNLSISSLNLPLKYTPTFPFFLIELSFILPSSNPSFPSSYWTFL